MKPETLWKIALLFILTQIVLEAISIPAIINYLNIAILGPIALVILQILAILLFLKKKKTGYYLASITNIFCIFILLFALSAMMGSIGSLGNYTLFYEYTPYLILSSILAVNIIAAILILKSASVFFGKERAPKYLNYVNLIVAICVIAGIAWVQFNSFQARSNYLRDDPNMQAISLVKYFENQPAQYGSNNIIFLEKNSEFSAKAIAEDRNIGWTKEHICFSLGQFSSADNFEISSNPNLILRYNGNNQQGVILGILCNAGNKIKQDFDAIASENSFNSGMVCAEEPFGTQTYCVLILRKY